MNFPSDLKYTKDHEWIRVEGGAATIGITDHAQRALGDIVFVELPALGKTLKQGGTFGVVESIKAVSDLYSPVAGRVAQINTNLPDDPAQVNKDPYAAWFFRLRPADPAGVANLLDARAYEAAIGDA